MQVWGDERLMPSMPFSESEVMRTRSPRTCARNSSAVAEAGIMLWKLGFRVSVTSVSVGPTDSVLSR